ncbi:ATP-binding protein, partial [Enterococcus faecalis]|nr:ATP-binding protein [Enterococcus faecalis]
MIKANWDIFKAKFSENPQINFEWLCYILFCKEFKKEQGIFRFKNQSGIETNPIIVEKEIIGWQAKFYDTKLSEHKSDIISTLEKSKRDYPNLTKIIFFSNQEWGQGRHSEHNDSTAKIDAEKKAMELQIELEWRTASFFESPFVSIDNSIIAQYFFCLNNSFIGLFNERQTHSEAILEEIRTSITFKNVDIEIERDYIVEDINTKFDKNQILIISGQSGVGKTAIVKQFYMKYKEIYPIYIFKASEFENTNVNHIFGNYNLQDFLEFNKEEEKKLIII